MLDGLSTKVKALCEKKGALTQAEKKDLMDAVGATVMELKSNLPFFQVQFEKAMEKSVAQAITEVEAHVQGLINQTGLAALANMAPAIEHKE